MNPYPTPPNGLRANLATLLRLGLNDVRLTARDRAAFFWILVLPIGMMWIFGQMGNTRGSMPQASLVLEDHDGGFLAEALRRELAGASDKVELEYRQEPPKPGEIPARRLILPAGLSDRLLAHQPQKLRLEVSQSASRELSQNLDSVLRRALVRVLGQTMLLEVDGRTRDTAGLPQALVALAAQPPLISLASVTVGRARTLPQGYAQSVPGILTMVVMMMTLIYGGVFLVLEKEQGLLRRQLTLPLSRGQLIAGKIFGRLAIASLQIGILVVVGHFVFGLDLGASYSGLALLLAAYAVAVSGLSILLGAWAKTREQASTLGWLSSMLMAALGGCWWPAEIMPAGLQQVALVFPTAWAMRGFHQLISYGNGLPAVVVPSLVLFGFGIAFGALGARVLRAA